MNADACLDELLPWVNRAVVDVLLRRRRDRDFAEDFRGWVVLKMLERNGAKLRCFRGESTLLTYLRVVVDRLYCDYLNALNGKWHPSKKAAELGSKTVELERLVYRDGFTLDQAVALMQVRDGGVSDSDLRAGFAKIPIRQKRSFVALDSVPELCADAGSSADAILWRREIEDQGIRLRGSLARALSELPEQDRYILDLRFVQGLRVSWISRLSGLSQRALYTRLRAILRVLRKKLEARGVGRACITPLLQAELPTRPNEISNRHGSTLRQPYQVQAHGTPRERAWEKPRAVRLQERRSSSITKRRAG